MEDYGACDYCHELNVSAARLARKYADDFTAKNPEKPRFVAGSIGPTNKTCSLSPDVNNPALRNITFDELASAYKDQIKALIEGGVDILDCEAISRQLSDLLDEADPIEGSYTLEVGSAGAERALKRPADFQRYLGSPVLVKLYKPVDGRKEFPGTLTAYNEADGSVTVDLNGSVYTFGKKDVALCRLRVEF